MDLVVAEQVDFGNLVRRFLVVILQAVQSKRNLVTMITILCLFCKFC